MKKIYIPRRDTECGSIITIDSNTTSIHDDALSVHKDGNKYIVDLFIADVGGTIVPCSDVDLDALNNFKISYGSTEVRLLHPKIEKQLSLESRQRKNAIKLTVVLNDSGEILDYYLKGKMK
ncbi:MAG: ribonuclease catalytic domain-containing protein [Clostridium sp.]|nr:MAG: ribonuclease catalytic domain-containing protein [Clostridium sp.]